MTFVSRKKKNETAAAHPFEYKDAGSAKEQSNAFKSFGTPKKEKKPFQYDAKEQQVRASLHAWKY